MPVVGLVWLESDEFESSKYAASDFRVDWETAKATCQQDGATLAVIESTEEDVYLRERFINHTLRLLKTISSRLNKANLYANYL